MKLGYSTWGMPKVEVDAAFKHISDLGFDGVELTVIPGFTTNLSDLSLQDRTRIRKLLSEYKLELPAIAAHSSLIELDTEKHKTNMERLKGAVDLAVYLAQRDSIPVVNTTSGGKPESWDESRNLLVERLQELSEYAQAHGVIIGIEPHIGAVIDTPQKVIEIIHLVNSPSLKVNFDISHFDIIGLTIEETVSALAPYSVHTHVKDQRGRHPNFEFLIPGEGSFDYVRYLKQMQAHGYRGYITAEVSFMVQRRPNYDPFEAATLSYKTLSEAFRKAGISRQ